MAAFVAMCSRLLLVGVSGRSQANIYTLNSRERTAVWSVAAICSRLITSLNLAVGGRPSVMCCLVRLSILQLIIHTVCRLVLML